MIRGWAITKDCLATDDLEIPSRVGWGQISQVVVEGEAEQVFRRTINITTDIDWSLLVHAIPFVLMDEDGVEHYHGVISNEWLFGNEALAFSPLRFAETDTGATIMKYQVEDGSWEHL